ncbi:MAG: hypothetical protein NT123_22520 [Proteobacteria bacterium]|nr:hypothetical protein [Pseudomonadota bacterium]
MKTKKANTDPTEEIEDEMIKQMNFVLNEFSMVLRLLEKGRPRAMREFAQKATAWRKASIAAGSLKDFYINAIAAEARYRALDRKDKSKD